MEVWFPQSPGLIQLSMSGTLVRTLINDEKPQNLKESRLIEECKKISAIDVQKFIASMPDSIHVT